MKVVATYSIKGGVGKTSAAVNLAALAAREGLRTVLWDLDPQGAASFLFRVEPKVKGGGSKLIRGKREPLDVMKGTDVEGLDLLPADFSYRHLDIQLDKRKKPLQGLARVLAQLEDAYDLAILDCAPSISLVSESVFAAADLLLVPLVPVDAGGAHARSAARRSWPGSRSRCPRCSRSSRWSTAASACTRSSSRRSPASPRAAIPNASQVELMGLRRAPLVVTAPRNPAALAYVGAVGRAARRAQGLTTRRRPNARRKAPSEIRRSRLQTASRSSPRSRRCSDAALLDEPRLDHRLVLPAVELLGELQQQRAAGDAVVVRRALAVVADDLRDQLDLARAVAGQAGLEDQVVRVLGVGVVADRHPDVVQQRGRPQQLALARLRLDHALGDQRVVELQREPRDVVGVADVGVELQREVADRGDADVGEQRRRAAQQPPAEEHALAQAGAGDLDRRRSRRARARSPAPRRRRGRCRRGSP